MAARIKMMNNINMIREMEAKVIDGVEINEEEALSLIKINDGELFELFNSANRIRLFFKGNKIDLCSIVNAKSGRCPEDCVFCSQSIHYSTQINEYPLLQPEMILENADQAIKHGARKFGIVTSGKGIENANELESICQAISKIKKEKRIHRCASLGVLTREVAEELKEAGLEEYHHNLETARSFYSRICSSRDYEENVETVRIAKAAKLRTCCGGIFGLGETWEQRIELAFTLRELDVDSVPLNFLHPIKGTPVEKISPLKPMEILKIIALYRFILPKKNIKVAGGREKNLRDMQSMMFFAGANSTMIGNYLTTKGRNYEEDLQMIKDLNLEIIPFQEKYEGV